MVCSVTRDSLEADSISEAVVLAVELGENSLGRVEVGEQHGTSS